ncbi:hypothetical protein MTP99_008533 [Tenebrio molitor]|nr:hypothetical protein MTP99_008533 [Tenebrio molitor]
MDPQFSCSYCNYTPKYKYHFVSHLVTVHKLSIAEQVVTILIRLCFRKSQVSEMSEFVQTQEHPSKTPEMGVWHPVKVSVQLVHVQGQAEGQLYQAREDLRRFKCPRCLNSYMHKSSLTSHQKWECGMASQFRCSLCSYASKHKHNYTRHMVIVHKIPKTQITP